MKKFILSSLICFSAVAPTFATIEQHDAYQDPVAIAKQRRLQQRKEWLMRVSLGMSVVTLASVSALVVYLAHMVHSGKLGEQVAQQVVKEASNVVQQPWFLDAVIKNLRGVLTSSIKSSLRQSIESFAPSNVVLVL